MTVHRSIGLVVVLALLVIGGIALWLSSTDSAPTVGGSTTAATARDGADAVSDSIRSAPTTATEPRTEVPERAAVDAPTAATDVPSLPLAVVRGHFVLPDGTPAAGASARVHGWQANQERVIAFGAPTSWEQPSGTVGADGNLELTFDPPRAFQFTLRVERAGFAPVQWRWSTLEPASVTDLGTVTLPWGCVVEGEIVDGQGNPAPLRWSVHAESSFKPNGAGANNTSVDGKVDVKSATFRIEGVPEGSATVGAYAQEAGWIKDATVDARRDRIAHVRLVYAGPDVSRSLTLMTRCERLHVFNDPDPAKVVLTGLPSGPIDGTHAKSGVQRILWSDLPQGAYAIDIDDPRFVRWTKSGLKPGDSVTAKLVGSCSVALTVVDPNTGAAIDAYRLRLRYRNVNFWPNEFVLREPKDAAPRGGLFEGIVPGDVALVVDADGFAATEFVLGPIEPRTTRAVTITPHAGAIVRGNVVTANARAPCAGVTVRLRPPLNGQVEDFFVVGATESLRRQTATDAQGAFEFTSVIPGSYELVAEVNALVAAPAQSVELKAGESVTRDLVLPEHGTLRGRLIWNIPRPPNQLRIAAREPPRDAAQAANLFDLFDGSQGMPAPVVTTVADDGTFTLDGLRAGVVEVVLGLPDPVIEHQGGSWGTNGDRFVIGTATVPAGDAVEATFDLGARHPGFARVRVSIDGRSAANVGVRAVGPSGAKGAGLKAAASLDAAGEAMLGPLLPGSYDLVVAPRDVSWFATLTASFALAPAATVDAAHTIAMHRGTIVLVDANDTPLPNRGVYFSARDIQSSAFTSNAEGRIDLEFPAFRGEIRDAAARVGTPATGERPQYDWPPANGELRVVLK